MRLSEVKRRLEEERGVVISHRALAMRCKAGEIKATAAPNGYWDVPESEISTIRPNRNRPPENGHATDSYNFPQYLKARYGVTPERYEAMKAAFEGRCPICQTPHTDDVSPHVDHCHDTERVRGLLCRGCNLGLGYFRENPEALRRAVDYLED